MPRPHSAAPLRVQERSAVKPLQPLHLPQPSAAIFCVWVLYSAVLGGLYAMTPPSPDQSIFDYIGWRALSGDRLYVDVVEQNWPGAMWLHTASVWLFGNQLWSFRLFDYAIMVAGASGLFVLATTSGIRWTGCVVVPLYQMMYVTSSPWLTGQRDMVGAHALILLSVLYLQRSKTWRIRGMLVFGAGMAIVVMTRPTYLLFPLGMLAFDLFANRRDREALRVIVEGGLAASIAFALTLAAIAAYGAYTGGLRGWYEAAVVFNLSAYSGSAPFEVSLATLLGTFSSWHWYYAFAAIGFTLWLARGRSGPLRAMSCMALTAVVSFAVQGKALGYHLAALLPVLALLAAPTIAWAFGAINRRSAPLMLLTATLILLIAVGGSAKKMHSSLAPQSQYLLGKIDLEGYLRTTEVTFDGMSFGDAVAVSSHLINQSNAEDTVLVWNRAIVINYLAKRRSPLPYATVGMLNQFRGTSDLARSWLFRLDHTLKCSPPKYIVLGVESALGSRVIAEPASRAAALATADAILAAALSSHYRFEHAIGGARLWVLDVGWRSTCQ